MILEYLNKTNFLLICVGLCNTCLSYISSVYSPFCDHAGYKTDAHLLAKCECERLRSSTQVSALVRNIEYQKSRRHTFTSGLLALRSFYSTVMMSYNVEKCQNSTSMKYYFLQIAILEADLCYKILIITLTWSTMILTM